MTPRVRVQNFGVSRDGIAAGEDQTLAHPFGHDVDPMSLLGWAGATASWPNRTEPGGSRGFEDYLTRDFAHGIGAEIMGRHKFAPKAGPWPDDTWTGWWGEEPPFHTPVFVLTSRPREPLVLGETTSTSSTPLRRRRWSVRRPRPTAWTCASAAASPRCSSSWRPT